MMGNCESYGACKAQKRNQLRHPIDRQSLYRDRIMDNQTVNRRCYESNPIEIVEGFGHSGLSLNKLLRWAIIVVVIYLIVRMVTDSQGNPLAGLTNIFSPRSPSGPAAYSATSPGMGDANLAGGVSPSLSELSFLKTE